MRDIVMELIEFNYWAARRVVDTARELPPERWAAMRPEETNIRSALVHCLECELTWRNRLQGKPRSEWVELAPEATRSVDALAQAWAADELEMREWLAGLPDGAFAAAVDNGFLTRRLPLWKYLAHVFMHGAQHRSEAAFMLTALGHSPGEIDFLDFLDAMGRGGLIARPG